MKSDDLLRKLRIIVSMITSPVSTATRSAEYLRPVVAVPAQSRSVRVGRACRTRFPKDLRMDVSGGAFVAKVCFQHFQQPAAQIRFDCTLFILEPFRLTSASIIYYSVSHSVSSVVHQGHSRQFSGQVVHPDFRPGGLGSITAFYNEVPATCSEWCRTRYKTERMSSKRS
jgi:hypothetical protein